MKVAPYLITCNFIFYLIFLVREIHLLIESIWFSLKVFELNREGIISSGRAQPAGL
jgi:hypothetical protein